MNVAVRKSEIARPLKVLVPMISSELKAANEVGLEHYRRAGEMLNEAKGQVPPGSWARWLAKNFELSQQTARRYMRLARVDIEAITGDRGITSYKEAIGEKPARSAWKAIFERTDRVNVTRLAYERQSREQEIKLHRDLALQLIDLGYRALATRLHPDRGGSRDAMARLNAVRGELKHIAENRRFI